MIIGIGIDILNINRIQVLSQNLEDSFFLKTFTKIEYEEALKSDNPIRYFATRFAAKEAIFKTFNIDGNKIRLNDIEIEKEESGCPMVKLYGQAFEIAKSKSITEIKLSISYDTDYAVAYATAVNERSE